MRIRPLFKWFGSKWSSARLLPAPEHWRINESYAGGAGYALNYADRTVSIYDTDPTLQMLWPWLISEATSADILEIPLGLPVGLDIRTIGLSRGQAHLLKCWQRTNNVGECWTISKWGHLPGQWTANTRARVADEVGAVKHWRWGPWDGSAEPTTFLVDPPYQFNYAYRQPLIDYAELAGDCERLAWLGHQVIVCEARHPKTDEAPTYLPFVDLASRATSRRKAGEHHHSRELIWAS